MKLDPDHPGIGPYLLGRVLSAAVQNGDITAEEMCELANFILGGK
jgi:hypothetical protein